MSRKKQMAMDIWQEVFADNPLFTKMYFDTIYSDDACYILEEGNRAIAHLQCIDIELAFDGNYYKGNYLSGVATLPEYRNRGLIRRLMNEAFNDRLQKGDLFSFLIPASEDLVAFYENKFGYKACRSIKETNDISEAMKYLPDNLLKRDSEYDIINEVELYRSKFFVNLIHSQRQIEAALADFTLADSAELIKIKNGNIIDAIAFVSISNNKVLVKDFFCTKSNFINLNDKIQSLYPTKQIFYNIASNSSNYTAMIKLLNNDNTSLSNHLENNIIYASLMLD